MTFHHRKSLENPENFAMKYASPCYMCYICPDDCTMYISPPPPPQPPPDKHQISTTLILMLCVLSAAFLFLSYLTICRYRSRRRNSMASSLENGNLRQDFIDENQRPVLDHHIWYIRTIGLQQTVIDSIPVFRYKDGEGLIEVRDCCVCLNEFKEDECLRLLPKCSHAFHLPCIDTWLRSHKNCPVCRAPVLINMDTNTGRVDSVETNTAHLGSREDNRTVINELETGQTGQTRGVAVENPNAIFRVLSDLTVHNRVPVGRDLKRVKRSLSLDFSSRSMICTKRDEGSSGIKMAIVEKRDFEMYNRLIKSSSHGHYVKKGPVLMKKSFSFSGKRSLRKHSRSLETISIPEISIQNCGS